MATRQPIVDETVDDPRIAPGIPTIPVPGLPIPDPPPPDPTRASWRITAQRIRVVDQQETNLTGGDEVYLVSLIFRALPGVVGSTQVHLNVTMTKIDHLHTGESQAIPIVEGAVQFDGVKLRGLADVAAGVPPEILGSVTFVWEDDGTPDNAIRNLFDDVAAVARTDLAALFERLTVADLADPDRLSDQMARTVADIKDEVVPNLLGKLVLLVESLGDVDDLIDQKLNVFVAVDDTLADVVDAKVGAAIDPSSGVGGALRPRTYHQRFVGDGATYDLDFVVTEL
jgi:hypothetical protein